MRNIKLKNEPEVKMKVSATFERNMEKMNSEINVLKRNIPYYKKRGPELEEEVKLYKMNAYKFRDEIIEKRTAILNLESEIENIRRTVDEFKAIKAEIMILWKCLDEIDADLKTNILIFFYSELFE
jgi:predicted  nucleic acid-binding Zn-ribbon protein